MKLVSCHIVGFGKFVNQTFDLSKPVVVFHCENGWGKTTLADFLESMFYGVDGGRSRSVAENDRIKYEPWSGARFGGSLTFTHANKTYRVERFFGKTPSADVVRVFDGNNLLCYDFGEKAEKLGETLFGVDRESYRRTAYLPQGEKQTGALTGDIKSRLLAILSSNADNGAQGAIDKLDAAERALRAKRRPAKGKLDEIDEKLVYIQGQKADCARTAQSLQTQKEELAARTARLQTVTEELRKLSALTEEYTRRSELAANRAARREMESKLSEANAALGQWNAFFNGNDPKTLNTEGLENAVKEFYALKDELAQTEERLSSLSAQVKEKQILQTQLSACEKTLESYELLRSAPVQTTGAGTKQTRGEAKFSRKKRFSGTLVLIASFAIAIFGATFVESIPALGISLLCVGALGLLAGFITLFKHTKGAPKKVRAKRAFDDPALAARYAATQAELAGWQQKLTVYPPDLEEKYDALLRDTEAKKNRVAALDTAIANFLSNFRFESVYDYRTALSRLQDGISQHGKYNDIAIEYTQKLSALPPAAAGDETDGYSPADMENLTARKAQLEREKERLTAENARAGATLETQEARAGQLADYQAEEEMLTAEKTRLEKRLLAVRTARELLLRARANMATRYLDPVEKNCRKYAQTLGFTMPEALRFSADGTPIVEENAVFRSPDYYSAGMQELLGFCVRVALAETIFTRHTPTLILDDPFTDLDDDKTARAKTLVRELSKKYQILYFTCKTDRTL